MRSRKRNASFARLGGSCCTTQEELLKDSVPGGWSAFPSTIWSYIDARDGAQAIRKALEASLRGAHIFIIANADTVLTRSNAEVLSEFCPSVPLKRTFAPNETLLSIEKARRVLGYEPQYSWRAA